MAKSPRGKFALNVNSKTPVVLLSAGVGQTPLVSMLNAIAGSTSDRETWCIHGSRRMCRATIMTKWAASTSSWSNA